MHVKNVESESPVELPVLGGQNYREIVTLQNYVIKNNC
jgi:hypothetical protein